MSLPKISCQTLRSSILVAFIYYVIFPTNALAEWYSDEQSIMGTSVSVKLWHEDEVRARLAIEAVMSEMRRIDDTLSPYKADSELSKVNREAGLAPMSISPELSRLIDKALYFSRASDGAFDISFASVGHQYDYREKRKPSEKQREQLMKAVNYRFIQHDKVAHRLFFTQPNLQIDLGGIAKGYAVDRAASILAQQGVKHATVSAGGDSRIIGDKRGEPWVIGIKKPRGLDHTKVTSARDEVAILLPLVNTAISTSGDYERYFIDPATGERVHHIINPRTGKSASGVVSVSILGQNGFDTDPLSTTVFVLGVEKGLALVNQFTGFDCVIIDAKGDVHYSKGLMPPVND
ncbi:FAD:protein FMN transferase [Aurantivibrio plasticivorans]